MGENDQVLLAGFDGGLRQESILVGLIFERTKAGFLF